MSFCNRCGKELADGSKFCAGCGAPVRQVESSATSAGAPTGRPLSAKELKSSASTQGASVGSGKVVGVLDAVLVVLLFMPLVNLNLYLWSDSYSLPGLVEVASSLQNNILALLGSSYTGSDFGSIVPLVLFTIATAWLAVEVLLIKDIYRSFVKSGGCHISGASAAFALAVLSLIVCTALNQAIGNQLGASVEVVSTTMWLWVSGVLALGTIIFASSKNDSSE